MRGHCRGRLVKFGDELVIRATNERVILLGVLDMSGTLLVGKPESEPFQVTEEEVLSLNEKYSGCGCC